MEIYVGNIPPSIKSEELHFLYQSFGSIVFIDIKNRCQPPFAFILFDNTRSAYNAVVSTNGCMYQGYQFQVKLLAPNDDSSDIGKKSVDQEKKQSSKQKQMKCKKRKLPTKDNLPVSDIPRRPRSVTIIPSEPHDPEEILKIIQFGNPELPTHNWKVVKVSAPEGFNRKAVVVLNKESLAPLLEKQGKIYYGFGSIKLRIYRNDKLDLKTSGVKMEAPKDMDCVKTDDSAKSEDGMKAQSNSCMVGDLYDRLSEVEDEDALQNFDPEDVEVTIVYDFDYGEDDPSEPSPF